MAGKVVKLSFVLLSKFVASRQESAYKTATSHIRKTFDKCYDYKLLAIIGLYDDDNSKQSCHPAGYAVKSYPKQKPMERRVKLFPFCWQTMIFLQSFVPIPKNFFLWLMSERFTEKDGQGSVSHTHYQSQ